MPIFDQGYQHWQGTLSGRLWRWWTITRYGVRAQLKNRWTRIVLLIALGPALSLAGAMVLWGLIEQKSDLVMPVLRLIRLPPELADGPKAFRIPVWTICYQIFFMAELYLSMVLVLLVGPNLISQDLRFNAIPLYLSRPLRRFDYFAGKLGVIAVFLGAVVVAPAILAYVLGLLFSLDLSVLKDTYHLLLGGIAYGLVIVVSAGLLMLALSSLSRSSRYVSIFWVAIWFVSVAVAFSLGKLYDQATQRKAHQVALEAYRKDRFDPQGRQHAQQEIDRLWEEQLREAHSNWRPLLSYTANLDRIGSALLNTQDAWTKLDQAFSGGRVAKRHVDADPSFIQRMTRLHAWYWSAGVLAGLLGASLWVLTTRVKSLDRLK